MSSLRGADILVTGACGFIGSHLTRRLVEDGAIVHAVDVSEPWRISDVRDRIDFKLLDLTDYNGVKRLVDEVKPVKVFHLAAKVNVKRDFNFLDDMIRVNLGGTTNLLRALDGASYDCFVNTGTCEEYGDNPAPFREEQKPNPVSPYSASKVASTVFCMMYHKTLGCPIVTLRPFLTYGPMQEPTMLIPEVITSALEKKSFKMTEGMQTREFNYVSDIVDGFVRASVKKNAVGEVINIGNGAEYRIRDVVAKIIKLMGSPIKPQVGALPYRPGEAMHFYCDNTKARRLLGWKPKVGLDEGLEKTIDWYEKNAKKG